MKFKQFLESYLQPVQWLEEIYQKKDSITLRAAIDDYEGNFQEELVEFLHTGDKKKIWNKIKSTVDNIWYLKGVLFHNDVDWFYVTKENIKYISFGGTGRWRVFNWTGMEVDWFSPEELNIEQIMFNHATRIMFDKHYNTTIPLNEIPKNYLEIIYPIVVFVFGFE